MKEVLENEIKGLLSRFQEAKERNTYNAFWNLCGQAQSLIFDIRTLNYYHCLTDDEEERYISQMDAIKADIEYHMEKLEKE